MRGTVFGLTEEQLTNLAMTYGLPAFILFMMFIIGHLAWESKAGKFGTFVLFMGLAVGMLGFGMKYIIQWLIGIKSLKPFSLGVLNYNIRELTAVVQAGVSDFNCGLTCNLFVNTGNFRIRFCNHSGFAAVSLLTDFNI